MLKIKRVNEDPKRDDGTRFLVERLWPRDSRRRKSR